jgi:hypothetical protein
MSTTTSSLGSRNLDIYTPEALDNPYPHYAMLRELSQRVQRFERTGDPMRSPSGTMRKFLSLPVRLVPTERASS